MKEKIISWVKNVVGESVSSKKTLFTVSGIASLLLLVYKTNPTLAIVCSTVCFVAWVGAQAFVDAKKIEKEVKN